MATFNNQNDIVASTRVLRVIRLLRELAFMKVIIQTFNNCLENFLNICHFFIISAFAFDLFVYFYLNGV